MKVQFSTLIQRDCRSDCLQISNQTRNRIYAKISIIYKLYTRCCKENAISISINYNIKRLNEIYTNTYIQ